MPYANQEMIDRVMEYRSKKLSFREIGKLLGKDVNSVYRWYSYGSGKISPGQPGRLKVSQETNT